MKKTIALLALVSLSGAASAQQQTSNGLTYTLISGGNGEKIKQSDIITFNVEQRTDKDSVLFSSYKAGQPVKTQVKPSENPLDLMDIFTKMGVNDSAVVKIPVDTIFKGNEDRMPPFLKKGSNIVTCLKIVKVQSLADAMAERTAQIEKLKTGEAADMAKYIADKKLNVTTTPSGLKYVITRPSAKAKPKNGDTVLVNYIGRTLEGKVFDTSIEAEAKKAGIEQPGREYEPIEVTLGEHRVISGWEEGLLLLNEGAKATFIIPSHLGYGERGAGADIKPYSTLAFDVELVKVKRAKISVAAKPKTTIKKAPVKKRPAKKTAAGKKKS